MKLSPDENAFIRRWIHDEAHYKEGTGPAKLLQVQHGVRPGELAIVIAAAIPDPRDQYEAAYAPVPPGPPKWPWSDESFQVRLSEAKAFLGRSAPPAIATEKAAVGFGGRNHDRTI